MFNVFDVVQQCRPINVIQMFCVYLGVTISDKISSQYSRHEIVQCVGGKRTDTENQAALTIVRRLSWRQKNWSIFGQTQLDLTVVLAR